MEKLEIIEYRVLETLREENKELSVQNIADKIGFDQSKVRNAVEKLIEKGMVTPFEERKYIVYHLTDSGLKADWNILPERIALKLFKNNNTIDISELSRQLGEIASDAIRGLIKRGWCEKNVDKLKLTEYGKDMLSQAELDKDELLWKAVKEKGEVWLPQGEDYNGPNGERLIKGDYNIPSKKIGDFSINKNKLEKIEGFRVKGKYLKAKTRQRPVVRITEKGLEALSKKQEVGEEKTTLTQELLVSGEWRNYVFKPYDVNLPSGEIYSGKSHPLRRILDETRRVFLEMGFKEISSPYVESSFWNFDALFQPQDHPAREMQDTFYTENPSHSKLPDDRMLERVKLTHENGGGTGSTGWGGEWSLERAKRLVLRTHTTATTVRYLAYHPNPPSKVFHVARVFRREKMTYKHLPEFNQVDGIVIDENANFSVLLGLLKSFYFKMGFKEIKFRPAFFPYTEPSVEVFVRMEKKEDWMELGGAGVFRPEVTLPFECNCPVLAWGLGMERLAMMRFGIEDIRKLYLADIDWLRGAKLCL